MLIYYLIIFLIILIGLFIGNKYKKIYVYFICILLTLIAGLRHYTVGSDTFMYYRYFNNALTYGTKAFSMTGVEQAYILLNYLFVQFSSSFNLFLIIISGYINFTIGKYIIEHSNKTMLSLLLFVLCRFFFSEMNIIRQMLSIAIIINGLKHVKKREFVWYLLYVIIACLIHKSAFISIILYFLYDYDFKAIKKIRWCVIIIGLFIFLGPFLEKITSVLGIYNGYVKLFMDSNKLGSFLSFITILFECIIVSVVIKKNKKNIVKNDLFLYNALIISLAFSFLSIRISILDRYVLYFSIFSIVLIPNIIEKISKSKNRMLAYVLTFLFFLTYFLLITYVRPEWNSINPYVFYWMA